MNTCALIRWSLRIYHPCLTLMFPAHIYCNLQQMLALYFLHFRLYLQTRQILPVVIFWRLYEKRQGFYLIQRGIKFVIFRFPFLSSFTKIGKNGAWLYTCRGWIANDIIASSLFFKNYITNSKSATIPFDECLGIDGAWSCDGREIFWS